jgi:hypothetical protein
MSISNFRCLLKLPTDFSLSRPLGLFKSVFAVVTINAPKPPILLFCMHHNVQRTTFSYTQDLCQRGHTIIITIIIRHRPISVFFAVVGFQVRTLTHKLLNSYTCAIHFAENSFSFPVSKCSNPCNLTLYYFSDLFTPCRLVLLTLLPSPPLHFHLCNSS